MADLSLISRFTVELNGVEFSGKQGSAADAAADAFVIDVDRGELKTGSLETATARTLWDEDADNPTGFGFLFLWASADCYVQLIGQATNYVQKVEAKVPFVLGSDQMLAAANTTALSGTEPSVEAVDSVVIQNNSGSPLDYLFFVGEAA